ncbi:MAG: hypothetical protein GF334_10675 [Candidatus Altiarchaeales archaeon]|nr:hypothetical protein [Candidatus Altiarchaeales archaeon]
MPKKKKNKASEPTKSPKLPEAEKCCKHCQDYKLCKERGECCEYCDYYSKGLCTYQLTKDLPKHMIEICDYRGDDYGIDDYTAYSEEIS